MIKDNEKLHEFIKNFMTQFDPSYGFQLWDGNSAFSFTTYLTERFENVRMNEEDLKDLLPIGFAISLSAYQCLYGEKFTEDKMKDGFDEFLEMALN